MLDKRTQDCFLSWEGVTRQSVAALRIEAGSNLYDRALTDLVGEIEVTGEALVLPADRGLAMIAYSVEPNSAAAGILQLLASWAASADQPVTAETPVRRNG